MRSDDETQDDAGRQPNDAPTDGNPSTNPETGAAGGEPIGGDAATSPTQPTAPWTPPPPPSPWQPQPRSGWNPSASSQWGAPPSSPGGWGAPLPPTPPVWQAGPGQQPGPSWQPQSSWQPQPAGSFDRGNLPPAGDFAGRRPSRLPMALVVIAACLIAFSGGLITDHSFFPASTSCAAAQAPTTTQAPSGTSTTTDSSPTCSLTATSYGTLQGYALYQQALQIVKQYYVGRSSVTDQQLLYGAILGMVNSLGDTGHSTFLTPEEYAAWQASLSANVAGIGVMLSSSGGAFTIERVIPGSPAEAAGVKAGDQITAVDGVSTDGLTFTQLSSKIRGDVGTKVTLTVIHLGSTTPVDIVITRANIKVPLADWAIVPGTHIADIVLTEFSQGAADQVQKDISAAKIAGATSIILDLRGNPGGYANEAQEVASEFLSSGVVYIQQDARGVNTEIRVDTSRTHTSLPLVVVVDHDSASASEIVAGALQDAGRARIVGVNTFGTGTVLQQFPLSDGSVVILGTAWWLTPAGHRIFGVGIKPDETAVMPAGVLPIYPTALPTMSTSGFNSSGDTQLLAAVKYLSK